MKLTLTLAQKAFVLVCVPLVFEIAFVATLAQLLQQAERERTLESHAKEVQSQVNMILGQIINAGAGLVIGEYARNLKVKEQYTITADSIKVEYAKLQALVRGDKKQEKAVNYIGELNEEIRLVLKQAKQDSMDYNRAGLVQDFGELNRLTKAFSKATGALSAEQKEIEQAKARARMNARAAITNMLYIGLLLNVSLAVSLALYFNRGTSRRMIILMDNTRRLARGQQLNPAIGGSDEIAHLDRTFNEMAQALEIAARKERAMIANARDVICSFDKDFKFTNVNPASVQVWGYASDELVGKGLELLLPEEQLRTHLESLTKISETDSSLPIENTVRKKDGMEIEMLWSVQWSKQEETYFCVAHDITERKQIERMKREFVAMVSHDLRTPLTSIQGFLSLLEAGAYGEMSQPGLQSLTIADNSISRLIKLINDLLDAERIESGMLELTILPVSLGELLEQSLHSVENFAHDHCVKIELPEKFGKPEDGTDIELKADGDRIIQVIINLLSNAVKFSPRGATVKLSCQEIEGQVEVRITDEGRGIPAEYVDTIFERFKQVKKSDSKNRKGTGLGLAICKAIIEKHGGQIGVTSLEGKGSTFWFRIPKELS